MAETKYGYTYFILGAAPMAFGALIMLPMVGDSYGMRDKLHDLKINVTIGCVICAIPLIFVTAAACDVVYTCTFPLRLFVNTLRYGRNSRIALCWFNS